MKKEAEDGGGRTQLPGDAVSSMEMHALLNATRHSGKAEVGAVISKIMGAYPDLRSRAAEVSRSAGETVARVNSMSQEEQRRLLAEAYPQALEPQAKEGGRRDDLPPLPGAAKGAVVLRLPPEPSGYMHIGHAMAGVINHTYREMYEGVLWLRFEDTNPRKVASRYYDSFRAGYRWMGISWDREKNVSTDIDLIYGYGRRLIEGGHAYACTCPADVVKRLRFEGRPCEHRSSTVEGSLEAWERMLGRSFREGECVIRLKGEMASLDTSMRDPNLFRVIESDHPVTGERYSVWPTYDLEVVVEDEVCGVTHILRSSEFHSALQDRLRELLSFRSVHTRQFSRFNFKGTPVQKRLLRPLVEKGLVSGWDDPRMPTIDGVRRRGIIPEAIRQFTLQVGYTRSEHEYDWSLLNSVNRKLLDPVTKRLFFVPDPARLDVGKAPRDRSVTIGFHPENAGMGSRTIRVSDSVYVPWGDLAPMREGDTTFRLMDLYNVALVSKDEGAKTAVVEYAGDELVREMTKLQWVAQEGRLSVRVMEPSLLYGEDGTLNEHSMKVTEGYAEASFGELREGEIVQFPRYGFCRVDSPGVCVLAHK